MFCKQMVLLESWMSLNSHGGRIYMSPLCYCLDKKKWETDFSLSSLGSMHIYNEAIWIRINIGGLKFMTLCPTN